MTSVILGRKKKEKEGKREKCGQGKGEKAN